MNYYKILLLGLVLLFSVPTAWAQTDKKEQRKIERAEKIRLKEEHRKKNQELLMELVKEQNYVLEATTVAGRYGNIRQVNPSTNFIMVEGNRIIVQTANNFNIGYNGLGGITINGTIRDYQISKDKHGVSVAIQFSDPVIGFSTLNLEVQENGNARASILGNWGGRASFQGNFVPMENARVFQGRPLI